jgi:hypothetical protein
MADRLAAAGAGRTCPVLPAGAVGGSYLVPYSFRRLDAFDGYQSGMPSPGYYQQLWEGGPQHAAAGSSPSRSPAGCASASSGCRRPT